ncbi:amidohydrolase [Oleiharenicola lentus]|uniref:Amidohydrolase n=1 Tax=Oleiharenicola lentus TaxID=2508720 RepID=A0A4Q1C6T3_9BACT|nr:amidohydrolase family protein [Oleiharenicola lentus]RXK54597.1 amidohydrolase [Oleiharenicola lentus]
MSFAYIDTHVHFWDRGHLPYPWLDEVPAIAGPHRPAELQAEAGGRFPEKIVFVECGAPWLDEVKWVEQLAAAEPRIAGIVAKCMVNEGATTVANLAELKKHPLVRGVRHLVQHEPDADFAARPEFIAGVRAVGAAGLSFDLCCFHHQLPAVVRLVQACPDTRFILDHFGKPGIRAKLLDPWRAHFAELAALPNVDCKLSGLITEADHQAWTPADLKLYVDHALATFGPGRLLFGGDWPVAKLAGAYPRWLDTARSLVSHLPIADQDAIFRRNALRVYLLA